MSFLTVSGAAKRQGDDFLLQDISFELEQGRKLAIAGATGSGKSSLLQIVAGLMQPDAGAVYLEGERVLGPEEKLLPGHPRIAYLSQQFELRNHYRVEELLEYATRMAEAEARELYHICRIDHLMQRKNVQLSGGERQRVALARLLVMSPSLLLLDEPFSNLDPIHKHILKEVLREIGERLSITSILVSHDPLDTLSWADEIMVLQDGMMVQQGSPMELYQRPVNEYSAALFGPFIKLPAGLSQQLGLAAGEQILRPGHFCISDHGISAVVRSVHFQGNSWLLEMVADATRIWVHSNHPYPLGMILRVAVSREIM